MKWEALDCASFLTHSMSEHGKQKAVIDPWVNFRDFKDLNDVGL